VAEERRLVSVHLIKVCVGIDSIAHLAQVQKSRRKGGRNAVIHYTRHMPKRADELLDGGSMFWIIKGLIAVRQRLVGFDTEHFEDEGAYCAIKLDRELVPVEPRQRRPHQGWRYLGAEEAPNDLKAGKGGAAKMPPELIAELKQLGLL
jgi:hypothetical protein